MNFKINLTITLLNLTRNHLFLSSEYLLCLPSFKDPILSSECLIPFPVKLFAIRSISDLFVGQTAQIKGISHCNPAAIANVFIPPI